MCIRDSENIISKYSDYVPTEAQRQLESELKTVEIALQFDRTEDNSNGDDLKNLGRITAKYGRMPLIISKLFVLIFFTIFICAVYYSSNIALCGLYSGFGDMTVSDTHLDVYKRQG